MAESILFDFAANIITKLGSLAIRELGFLCGVDDELHKLEDTLSAIKAVLLDAEKQQVKRDDVKNWIARLKDAIYEIDDLIDEFSYETLRRKVRAKNGKKAKEVRIFFSKSNQIAFRLKMGHKIKEINESLQAISDDKNKFGFSGQRGDDTRDDGLRNTRETVSFIPEGEMMGRDDDKKAIINLLLDTNVKDNIAVVAIVGMGGVGKTALVQSIIHNEKIIKHFDLQSWVCVSEEFDVKIIIQKVIESITKKKPKSFQKEVLQQSLREKINGKKYLLVLDDVWNKKHGEWDDLKRLLMGGARGSRIVITTRDEQVATTCNATSKYPLGKLDEKNSWLLFEKMALGGEKVEEQALVNIGKEIVAILKGVPLAIRTIGRHLNVNKSKSYWLSFKENELNRVMQLEIEIQPILELSYNHLSSNLKQCFVYCALFPKDYEIQKDEVIRQWVAQGFIQPHATKAIEDVGEDYFLELLWGSFFQDITKNELGDIEQCKMHDLMHDLASSIAKNEGVLRSMDGEHIDRRTRHVSFDLNPHKGFTYPKSLIEAKNLRTLDVPYVRYAESVHKIASNHLRLRTLVWINAKGLLKSISKLKHLRYLNLSKHDMEFLPNSITELYNLETLILYDCFKLRELPKDTKNWINLRHLDLNNCYALTHMPKGLGRLTCLQTMNLFVLGEKSGSGLSELNGLNNLRGFLFIQGLQICKSVDLRQNAKYLNLKPRIQNLYLDWDWENDENMFKRGGFDDDEKVLECLQPHSNVKNIVISNYEGMRLCSWVSSTSLVNLVGMYLSQCKRLQHLPQFDQFPHLKYLHLDWLDCIEYIHDNNNDYLSSSTFFPSLEILEIAYLPKLKGLWPDELSLESSQKSGSSVSFPTILPCLSNLDIGSCPQLIELIPWHAPLPISTLRLWNVSSQLLKNIVMKANGEVVGGSCSTRFKLKNLDIGKMDDLEILSQELFCNLTDLEDLSIGSCQNIQFCSLGVKQHSKSNDEDGAQWKELTSLRSLSLMEIPKLEYLPKDLKHVTTLQSLSIRDCPNLMTLPEWIDNFTLLSSLEVYNCPNLASLPERMCHLHSLQTLSIIYCPKLEERCKKGIGEDWPKIAHVPDLQIGSPQETESRSNFHQINISNAEG